MSRVVVRVLLLMCCLWVFSVYSQKLDSIVIDQYNTQNGGRQVQVFSYNSMQLVSVEKHLNAQNLPVHKKDYSYNIDSTLQQIISYDRIGMHWKEKSRESYSYYADKKIGVYIKQTWNDADQVWLNEERISYIYNVNGRIVTQLNSDWDQVYSSWEDLNRIKYQYTAQGLIDVKSIQNFYAQSNTWADFYKYTHQYTSSGLLEKEVKKTKIGNNWRDISKKEFTYNLLGQVTEMRYSNWHPVNLWELDRIIKSEYNNDEMIDKELFFKYGNNGQGSSGFYIEKQKKYYYSPFLVTSQESYTEMGKWTLYPNPVKQGQNIFVDGANEKGKLLIFNSMGQEVFSQSNTAGFQLIPTRKLNPGRYFIIFVDNDHVVKRWPIIIE